MEITVKNKLFQFFCKHKNKGWYRDDSTYFQIIHGERHYEVCRNCSKVLDEKFIDYDDNHFK